MPDNPSRSLDDLLRERARLDSELLERQQLVAVLLVDLVGSTRVFDQRGNVAGMAYVQRFVDHLSPLITQHGGVLVKTIGDAIMACFESPAAAVRSAVAMQQSIADANPSLPFLEQLHIRAAVNFGPALLRENDLFGDVVNVAARIEAATAADEILISPSVYRLIEAQPEFAVRQKASAVELKGKAEKLDLYAVLWRPEAQALAAAAPASSPITIVAVPAPSREPGTPSIAVLPFANLSAEKDNEYFSDGLAEEILNGLTQLRGLRVIARASAFSFRGREHAIAEIAEKLRVQHILQGSVRRTANRVRITAQLVNVSDESQIWSERYDRELTDVFAIQEEIAQAIVDKLKVDLEGRSGESLVKHYTENLDAHNLYLKGVFHSNRYTPQDLAKAYDYLHQAVALEPRHAGAWVQLAEYHIHRSFGSQPSAEMPLALEAAQRAIAADASLSAAQAALAFGEAFYEHRWTDGWQRIEAASGLPPTAWYFVWGGSVYLSNGKIDQAERFYLRALETDPLAFVAHFVLALLYNGRGQHELALQYANRLIEINPKAGGASWAIVGSTHISLGRTEEGISWLERAQQDRPSEVVSAAYLAKAYVDCGRRADAERLMADVENMRRQSYASAYWLAVGTLAVGDFFGALDWLEKAATERDLQLGFIPGTRDFDALRSHPRFAEIMKSVGLPILP